MKLCVAVIEYVVEKIGREIAVAILAVCFLIGGWYLLRHDTTELSPVDKALRADNDKFSGDLSDALGRWRKGLDLAHKDDRK